MKSKRVILITGATRGIGAAMTNLFAAQGADLILTGTKPREIAALNKSCGPRRRYVAVDLANPSSLNHFLAFIAGLKRLDVCVNNAGINIIKPVDKVTAEELDRLTAIDYRAPYLINQAAARVMKRGGRGGRILNVASIWSLVTRPGRSIYSAAKAGVAGMTRAMATELAPDRILVNCISPGFTLTDLTRKSLSKKEQRALAAQVPLGRLAEPEEIARVAVFLCSLENTYLTGQNIVVDGGFTNV